MSSLAGTCPCLLARGAGQEAFLEEAALLPLSGFLPASLGCSFSASLWAHFPPLAPSSAVLLGVWLDQSLQNSQHQPTRYFFCI